LLCALAINYTGIIGIGAMSMGMLLALRPGRLEPLLGGLDKTYRLHKWLGITGLVIAVIHWLWAQGTKWAGGIGITPFIARMKSLAVEPDSRTVDLF
jgi:predicted ferric reductase